MTLTPRLRPRLNTGTEEAVSVGVLGFLVGVVVGAVLAFLLAPTAYLLVGRSEWKRASRELELADRLLQTLSDPPGPDIPSEEPDASGSPRTVAHDHHR
jgi:hypothetical protein